MDRSEWLSLLAGAALAVAMMAAPFLFPHMSQLMAQLLFFGGLAVFLACLIFLIAWKRKPPAELPKPAPARPTTTFQADEGSTISIEGADSTAHVFADAKGASSISASDVRHDPATDSSSKGSSDGAKDN